MYYDEQKSDFMIKEKRGEQMLAFRLGGNEIVNDSDLVDAVFDKYHFRQPKLPLLRGTELVKGLRNGLLFSSTDSDTTIDVYDFYVMNKGTDFEINLNIKGSSFPECFQQATLKVEEEIRKILIKNNGAYGKKIEPYEQLKNESHFQYNMWYDWKNKNFILSKKSDGILKNFVLGGEEIQKDIHFVAAIKKHFGHPQPSPNLLAGNDVVNFLKSGASLAASQNGSNQNEMIFYTKNKNLNITYAYTIKGGSLSECLTNAVGRFKNNLTTILNGSNGHSNDR